YVQRNRFSPRGSLAHVVRCGNRSAKTRSCQKAGGSVDALAAGEPLAPLADASVNYAREFSRGFIDFSFKEIAVWIFL
ncbi:MAG: hypothetical protein ABEJ06_05345, partial [Haloarculaceae archaeon]